MQNFSGGGYRRRRCSNNFPALTAGLVRKIHGKGTKRTSLDGLQETVSPDCFGRAAAAPRARPFSNRERLFSFTILLYISHKQIQYQIIAFERFLSFGKKKPRKHSDIFYSRTTAACFLLVIHEYSFKKCFHAKNHLIPPPRGVPAGLCLAFLSPPIPSACRIPLTDMISHYRMWKYAAIFDAIHIAGWQWHKATNFTPLRCIFEMAEHSCQIQLLQHLQGLWGKMAVPVHLRRFPFGQHAHPGRRPAPARARERQQRPPEAICLAGRVPEHHGAG